MVNLINEIKQVNNSLQHFSYSKYKSIILISWLPQYFLTEELMSTQLYDKVEEYRTLYYTKSHLDNNNIKTN